MLDRLHRGTARHGGHHLDLFRTHRCVDIYWQPSRRIGIEEARVGRLWRRSLDYAIASAGEKAWKADDYGVCRLRLFRATTPSARSTISCHNDSFLYHGALRAMSSAS